MELWNRLIAVGRERGKWWKESEWISQQMCMNDSWKWTMEKGLTVGKRGGLDGGMPKGKKLGQL